MGTNGALRSLSMGRRWIAMGMMLLSGGAFAADPGAFAGTWVRDRNKGESIGLAIENYVSDFDSLSKVRVRERLGQVSQASEQLVFAVVDSGRKISIGENGRVGTIASLDGKAVSIKGETGESFEMSVSLESDKLSESYQAADGGRTNVYAIADKGKSLLVDVKIESPYMPMPLFFKLVYARK